jgi:predicted methyltransferase
MARNLTASMLAALAIGAAGVAMAAASVPANITAALADKARPEADTKRDAARHPGEMLAYAGVKPGDKVADFMMGGGYFTRILASAVGPKGKVYAYQAAEFISYRAVYGEEQKKAVAGRDNVVALNGPLPAAGLPDGLDLVLTVQNYHDMHLKSFPADTAAKVNAEVFKALKPGGVYLVVDHVALPGAPIETANELHRIDPAIVKTEVVAAGFKFDGESPVLRDSGDPHTANVFDPSIRGKTDQFIYKFRKPK